MPHRRLGLAVVAPLLMLAAWSFAAAGEQPRVTSNTPLAEYARQSASKDFYGIYMLGGKNGWVSEQWRMTTHKGKPVFEGRTEVLMEIAIGRSRKSMSLTTLNLYSLEADGAIVYAKEAELDDGVATEREAVREGGNLRITTTEGGKASTRVLPLPRDTLKSRRDLEVWLGGARKKGDTFPSFSLDLGEDRAETEMVTEFLALEQLVWGGVPVRASKVKQRAHGAVFDAVMAPNGRVMRGKIGGLFEFRSEEEAVAKARGNKPVDMLAASHIRISAPLGEREEIQALTLELSALGDFVIPSSARQQVRKSGEGRAVVQLFREPSAPVAVSLTGAARENLLKATPSVQSDDPEIRALTRRIVGTERDPRKAAALLADWVNRNLWAMRGVNASTATAVLKNKAGDCTEHTLLFTALARAAGIPTRQMGGIMYAGDATPMFAWHAWAEIHDGRGWVSVDPTWKQVGVDATHVAFAVDYDDMERMDFGWFSILGSVQVKVIKVDRGA